MKSREHGYSIAEMLTVVTIIGLLALASVPAFITFRSAGKMRNSVRTFTTDLRGARQRAITTAHQVLVTYGETATGATPANYQRTYYFFEGDLPSSSTTWTPIANTLSGLGTSATAHTLDDIVYFPTTVGAPQRFDDTLACTVGSCSSGTDNRPELIFFPDGHARVPSNSTSGQIAIQTDAKIPGKKYIIEVYPSGSIKATAQ